MADTGRGFTVEEHLAGDGYRWRYRRYRPSQSPKAHIIGIHGIQSHGGWYEYSSGRLRDAGFEVSFLDRRGSGLNQQAQGDAPSFRRLVADLAEFLQAVRATAGSAPVFLIAISWGGKLGVALEALHPGLMNGLVLVCPGFCPRVRPPWKERLAIAWARLVAPGRLFPIPLNDPALFTATPRWQQFIRDDPLSLRLATARLLVASVRLDSYVRYVKARIRLPVLLLLAEHDRIIDNARTHCLVAAFPAADKEVIEYSAAHHTLEFEPEPERFIGDLRRWLENRLERKYTARGPT